MRPKQRIKLEKKVGHNIITLLSFFIYCVSFSRIRLEEEQIFEGVEEAKKNIQVEEEEEGRAI